MCAFYYCGKRLRFVISTYNLLYKYSVMDASKAPVQNNSTPANPNDRLATLGVIASNISHDLNNLIMTIQGSAEMGLRELHNVAKINQGLETILVAARHSKELIEQIQAFSRCEEVVKIPVDLRKVLIESRRMLEVKTPKPITLKFVIPEEEIFVLSNESQIHQVLMHLYQRAIQSMIDVGGGLQVTLQAVESNEEPAHARLIIEDTGAAIPSEIRKTIFDPICTSQTLGIGTGLGLALSKEIIEQHQGVIQIASKPARGTICQIMLPITHEQPPHVEREAEFQLPPSHEKKNILLVDDEPFMRGLGMDMLHSLGYRVSVAADGKEALQLIMKSPNYFDIILSDSKMPEMTGPELAEKLHELNPGLPFVLVSAFTDDFTAERLKTIGVNDIVKKPFLVSNLAKALAKALGQ